MYVYKLPEDHIYSQEKTGRSFLTSKIFYNDKHEEVVIFDFDAPSRGVFTV